VDEKSLKDKLETIKKQFNDSLKKDPIPPDSDEPPKSGEVLSLREQDHFDDECFLRHLRARQWDISKTLLMLRENLRWRRTVKPYKIRCSEIETHFRSGKNYHNGFTKKGQPIVYMRVRLDTVGDNEGKIKTIIYQMERSFYLMESRRKKIAKKKMKKIKEIKKRTEYN